MEDSHAFRVEYLSPKIVKRSGWTRPGTWTHTHWCPACRSAHDYAVDQPFHNGAQWTYNGDSVRPTFTPSMNISWGPTEDGDHYRCHYFVTDGKIIYCGDSTHGMAGQTVELPDFPVAQVLSWKPYEQ